MVYGRHSPDATEPITLLHSGKLWHDALVLMDRDTGSLWSQATGEAIQGPLKGSRLERLPARLTTWSEWLERHPRTLVLPADRSKRKLLLRLYPRSNAMLGILGTRNPDERLPGKTFVAGFAGDGEPVAVALASKGAVQEARLEIDGEPVLVRHLGGEGPTEIWRTSGPPDWTELEALPAETMYWFVWSALHPGSRIVHAEEIDATP